MARSILMLAAGCLLIPCVLFAQGEKEEDAFDRAFELYCQGRLKEAEAEYRKALKEYPDSVGANLELGRLLLETDRPDEAIPFLETARELAPSMAATNMELGSAHVAKKNWDEAEKYLKKACTLDGKDPYALWQLGHVLMQKEKWPNAEKYLKRAVAIEKDLAEGWLDLGMVQRKRGNGDKALLSLRRATETDPTLSAAFQEYASAVEELGDENLKKFIVAWKAQLAEKYGDAERGVRSLLKEDPENARYHLLLGHVLLHQTPPKTDGAVEAYDKALELDKKKAKRVDKLPDRSRSVVLEGVGIAHLLKKDEKKAREAFTLGLKADPDYAGHSYYLAVVAARDGKINDVVKRLAEVRKKDYEGTWVARAKEDEEFKIYRDRKEFFEALEGE